MSHIYYIDTVLLGYLARIHTYSYWYRGLISFTTAACRRAGTSKRWRGTDRPAPRSPSVPHRALPALLEMRVAA